MWKVGCAVTITAIWRSRVDSLYTDGLKRILLQTLGGYKKAIYEAFGRFKLTLYPLTGQAKVDIEAAELIQRTWMILSEFNDSWLEHEQQLRVGVFDGGPRGNPGSGGSGSVILEYDQTVGHFRILWAAATALGSRSTTNNLAEFIEFHAFTL
ncbi:hypothetical protein JG687_00018278 [Phytophthora cactorum]|uniref:Uncharacterized protein n=1 Tax=Phytophthora cactorum TaxID=29920 RepID=A0A8T1TKZ9_9STRA|nr:hypothetical protein JG687_00018278 [Phytophthora cactorum]